MKKEVTAHYLTKEIKYKKTKTLGNLSTRFCDENHYYLSDDF